jgi:hypothetical protein
MFPLRPFAMLLPDRVDQRCESFARSPHVGDEAFQIVFGGVSGATLSALAPTVLE